MGQAETLNQAEEAARLRAILAAAPETARTLTSAPRISVIEEDDPPVPAFLHDAPTRAIFMPRSDGSWALASLGLAASALMAAGAPASGERVGPLFVLLAAPGALGAAIALFYLLRRIGAEK